VTPQNPTRGLAKPSLAGRPRTMPRCAAMAVGSVPHTDPARALAFVLSATPDIPAWPQLPRRSFLENMYVQFSEGLPGVRLDTVAERIWVLDDVPTDELTTFVELLAADDPAAFALTPEYAAALPLLGQALRGEGAATLAPAFVKGQVTGPVSFGLTIARADKRALLYDDTLRDASVHLLAMKARWQAALLTAWAPHATPLIMVDEPYLTQMGSAFVAIPEEIAFPALEAILGAIDCLAGLHVCGGTDWERMAQLPLDVLNFDATDYLDAVLTRREAVAAFVAEGGLLAWGAVPNDDRALTWTSEEAAGRVLRGAEALARTGGVGVDQVLEASFVSPACGTGSLPLPTAEACFRVAADTAVWLRERLGPAAVTA
jgi:hypothetical protein